MKQAIAWLTIALFLSVTSFVPARQAYTFVSTVPQSGGCPQPNHWNLSVSSPLDRQWSTSLPPRLSPVILTVAPAGHVGTTRRDRAIHLRFVFRVGGSHRHNV